MSRYDGFRWIKVPRYQYDPARSWEQNYQDLESHHLAETMFLIEEVRKLADELARSREELNP